MRLLCSCCKAEGCVFWYWCFISGPCYFECIHSVAEPQLLPRPCWVENHCSSPTEPHQSVWILPDPGIGENYREWGRRYCVLFSWLWVLFLYRLFSAIICFHWNLIVSCQIWNALTSCLHLDQSSSGCSLNKLFVHVKYIRIYIYTSMCMKM